MDFGGDEKRGLLSVIKQRCLRSKVSDPIAAEERLWGCYCVIQDLKLPTLLSRSRIFWILCKGMQ